MEHSVIGCIGLGVMGEPICAHLLKKSGCGMLGCDLRPKPLARLVGQGLRARTSAEEVAHEAGVVFLSLPGGPELEELGGRLLGVMPAGSVLVDLSTAPVALTRELAERFGQRGVAYADAPVARTRAAAERGALSVMVGAEPDIFGRIDPYLRCFATDVLHCGQIGTGQIAKLTNNMVLFEIGGAIAEALAIGRQSGIEPAVLLQVLGNGSADSFCLRNHGHKAMLPKSIRSGHSRRAMLERAWTMPWRWPPRPASTPPAPASPASVFPKPSRLEMAIATGP